MAAGARAGTSSVERRTAAGRVMRFGVFEVHPGSGELRKHGLKIKLSPQAFQVLLALLEAGGEPVSREELRRRLWPEDTHVAFETNLNSIIHSLREALGDSARSPRFIETVSRRGYRFLLPVQEIVQARPAAGGKTFSRRLSAAVALVGLGLALTGWVWLRSVRSAAPGTADLPELSPLTSYKGTEGHPTFSPDGTRVAFHWNGPGRENFDIYLKSITGEDLLQLTDDPADDRFPAWSPDGLHVAFVRKLPGYRSALMLAPVRGGREQMVAVLPTARTTLSWSPDGRWIAYSVALPDYLRHSTDEAGIFAIALDTGRTVRITQPGPLSLGDHSPAISPAGDKLAFVRTTSLGVGYLYAVRINKELKPEGEPWVLIDGEGVQNPVWSSDGRYVLFVSWRKGYASLWKVRVDGRKRSRPEPVGGYLTYEPAISPDGRLIVFASQRETDNLWKLALAKPGVAAGRPERLTESTRFDRKPVFSPDGRRVIFGSNRSGKTALWVCGLDGAGLRQVGLPNNLQAGTPHWSPDGAYVAFDSRVGGRGDIFVVSAGGGSPRRLTANPADDIVPSWSRDGRWIYFASNRSGDFQVWKVALTGGEPVRLTRNGGFHAEESRDGRWLYYAKSVVFTEIWRMPAGGGEEELVVDSLADWANFAVGADGIYFTPGSDREQNEIHFFDVHTGRTRVVVRVDRPLNQGLTLSPDGRVLVYSKPEPTESDLMIMETSF